MRKLIIAIYYLLLPSLVSAQVSEVEKLIIQAQFKEGSKEIDAAESLLTQAVASLSATEEERGKALMQRGKIRMNRGNVADGMTDLKEATQFFTTKLAVDPKNCLLTMYRGMSYRFLKQYDLSMIDLNSALELCPSKDDVSQEIEATSQAKKGSR
jgi:tetratricopeptide (TPR) repeat protein